jgi:8-oxo-dGTP pyrophosphatase MutT (NUDIX family)
MSKTRFVAKALVFDRDGRFLRLTRSDSHPALAGHYDLPGGTVETGEEPGSAVIREILEETSLVISPEQCTVLYAVTLFMNNQSFPTLLYKVQLEEAAPDITLSYEHKSYSWQSIDQMTEIEPHIAPTYRQAFEYLRQHDML